MNKSELSQRMFPDFVSYLTEYVSPYRSEALSTLYSCVYRLDYLPGGLADYKRRLSQFGIFLLQVKPGLAGWANKIADLKVFLYPENKHLGSALNEMNGLLLELALSAISVDDKCEGGTDQEVTMMGERACVNAYLTRADVRSKRRKALVGAVK